MTPSISRPVRPVDGASVVLVRGRGVKAEVLMGRRRPRAAFLPNPDYSRHGVKEVVSVD